MGDVEEVLASVVLECVGDLTREKEEGDGEVFDKEELCESEALGFAVSMSERLGRDLTSR